MSDVTLTIGGRQYAVACAAGEEAHVARLGRMIDSKLAEMPGGQSLGETRSLLFAALLLADRIHDLEEAQAKAPQVPGEHMAALASRLEHLATMFESRG